MSTGTYDRDEITAHKEKQAYPSSSPSASSVGHTAAYGTVDDSALDATLYPDDSYTPDGTYWADLPRAERSRFVNKQFTTEWGRELRETWGARSSATRARGPARRTYGRHADPGAPLKAYWNKYVLTGMGLFVEGEPRLIRLGGRIALLLTERRRQVSSSSRSVTSNRSLPAPGRSAGETTRPSAMRVSSPTRALQLAHRFLT